MLQHIRTSLAEWVLKEEVFALQISTRRRQSYIETNLLALTGQDPGKFRSIQTLKIGIEVAKQKTT